jgi:hypothetical protein
VSENALVPPLPLFRVCLRCRCMNVADEACVACGHLVQGSLAYYLEPPETPRPAPRYSSPSERDGVIIGRILQFLLTGGFIAGVVLMCVGPAAGLFWPLAIFSLIVTGPGTAMMMFAFRKDPGLMPRPRRLRSWWHRLRARKLQPALRTGALLLPPRLPVTSRVAFEGRIAGDARAEVGRVEVWFDPEEPRAPVAWESRTRGFTLEADDGALVDVRAGRFGVDVPEDHPRVADSGPLHAGAGRKLFRVTVVLRAGQRIRLQAEVDMASPDGYRGDGQRWTVRGVPTVRPLPASVPALPAAPVRRALPARGASDPVSGA